VKLLLDTHTLVWFLEGAALDNDALFKIAEAQYARTLFVSPITAWEVALASAKANHAKRPNLLGQDPPTWFRNGCRTIGARIKPIRHRIAIEAASIPLLTGHGDPGDCFILATGHVAKLAIVTRDSRILDFAAENADYVRVIPC
jgi:PIN domain nuclease of toxin-antitoxin system